MITDEMVGKAVLAGLNARGPFYAEMPIASLEELPPALHWRVLTDYRAALEAVAADIRNAALEEAEEMVLPYTQPSPVRNYGPQGTTKIEAATMETAQFILQDLQALKSKVTP